MTLSAQGHTEAAQRVAERLAALLALAERNPELFGDPVAVLGRVCESSGYCGCGCKRCLGGRHRCGHRKQCHVLCKGLV